MSKIAELQAAQKQYCAAVAELKAPSPASINLENSSGISIWGYVQFTPEADSLEIRIEGHAVICLKPDKGRQLLNALKELYE